MISPTLKYPFVTGTETLNAIVAAATNAMCTAGLALTLTRPLPGFELISGEPAAGSFVMAYESEADRPCTYKFQPIYQGEECAHGAEVQVHGRSASDS